MSIERARQLLGDDVHKFSDESIEQMIKGFELIADIIIEKHLQERS